jgi:hypothetical protein
MCCNLKRWHVGLLYIPRTIKSRLLGQNICRLYTIWVSQLTVVYVLTLHITISEALNISRPTAALALSYIVAGRRGHFIETSGNLFKVLGKQAHILSNCFLQQICWFVVLFTVHFKLHNYLFIIYVCRKEHIGGPQIANPWTDWFHSELRSSCLE